MGRGGVGNTTNLPFDALASAIRSARRSAPHPSNPARGRRDSSGCGHKRATFAGGASRFRTGQGVDREEGPLGSFVHQPESTDLALRTLFPFLGQGKSFPADIASHFHCLETLFQFFFSHGRPPFINDDDKEETPGLKKASLTEELQIQSQVKGIRNPGVPYSKGHMLCHLLNLGYKM
jgi:hypothetical protein